MDRFKTIASKIAYKNTLFKVQEEIVEQPTTRKVTRYIVSHPGAVVFIPQKENKDLILVRQYREAIKEYVLEFPAGTLDLPEETPLECAQREMSEEIKMKANNWQEIGHIHSTPGFTNEVLHCFFANNLSECYKDSDDDEILEIITLSIDKFENLIKDGIINDAKTIAIYFKAKLKGLL